MTWPRTHTTYGESQNSNPSLLLLSWFIFPRTRPETWCEGKSFPEEVIPGCRQMSRGWRQGKEASRKDCAVYHNRQLGASLPGGSGHQSELPQCRPTWRVGAAGFTHQFPLVGWLRAVLTQAEYTPAARKKSLGQRIACVCSERTQVHGHLWMILFHSC